MKTCVRCKETKSPDDFYKNKELSDGRNSWCKVCQKEYGSERQRSARMTVLEHYSKGEMACACCGESNLVFLVIDHVFDDGAAKRREHGNNYQEFLALIRNGFPLGYQVLCHNCNWAKRYGPCPHQVQGQSLRRVLA